MTSTNFSKIFTPDILKRLFPEERTDQFFEVLFGDAAEGAYNISLGFKEPNNNQLLFELQLKPRPGKCLACNLTYGLPEVFSRHPVINIKGLVQDINEQLDGRARCIDWQLGFTETVSGELHVIPLTIILDNN